MHIIIATVGRLRDPAELALFDTYARRIGWTIAVREVELKRPLPANAAKAAEGALLLDAIGAGTKLVALDEGGSQWTSAEFAAQLGRWRDQSVGTLAFAIGGADGLSPDLLDRAAVRLAFGRMTWPHRLVRIMLAEQLYRAQQILAGHPYHRG
jgi:23S rRNA (pseudouridine1915-N3)-methyltransferase